MSLFVHRGNINSTCVNILRVSLLNGTATAQLKDGSVYHYTNVSRRAIAKFLMDDATLSAVCRNARVAYALSYVAPELAR